MEYCCIGMNDLPDEILLDIFKNLNNLEVLYSLTGVNKRLNKIVHDPNFTSCSTLFQRVLDEFIYPLPDPILDRFYLKFIIKSNGLILNQHLWNVFFLLQIILIYTDLVYMVSMQKKLYRFILVSYFNEY